MARNKLRKEKELNQIKKSTNVFFNIIFIILSALCIFPIVFVFSISISSETVTVHTYCVSSNDYSPF